MMARVSARAVGSAPVDEVWDRFARPQRWREWAPQVRRVDVDVDVIAAGAAGRLRGSAGTAMSFIVLDVDPVGRCWSWRLRAGRVRLHVDHEVTVTDDGRTAARVVVHGPWLAVRCCSLPARLALARLVRR